jgi:hypothetical protein
VPLQELLDVDLELHLLEGLQPVVADHPVDVVALLAQLVLSRLRVHPLLLADFGEFPLPPAAEVLPLRFLLLFLEVGLLGEYSVVAVAVRTA